MDQQTTPTKKLVRSKTDRIVAGVCGGLAQYFNVDPTVVRLIFAILIFGGGFGVALYVVLWIIMPEEGKEAKDANVEQRLKDVGAELKAGAERVASEFREPKLEAGGSRRLFAVILIIVGALALLNSLMPWGWFEWKFAWPALIILAGLYLIFKR